MSIATLAPSWLLLRLVGKALLKIARDEFLAPRPDLARALPDAAQLLWRGWAERVSPETRAEELEATARPVGRIRPYVELIVHDIAANEPAELRKNLLVYLSVIPSTLRSIFRRPSDPAGITIPPGLVPRAAEDFLVLLPPMVPIFEPGARPLDNIDWELVDLLSVSPDHEVWKARNPTFETVPPVLLRFFTDHRWKNEFANVKGSHWSKLLSKLDHPGVAELRATYFQADPPCVEFEYANLGDLAQWFLDRPARRPAANLSFKPRSKPDPRAAETDPANDPHFPWTAARVARLIHRLASILGDFHRGSPPFVHGGLAPSNILLHRDARGRRRVKIADFGFAEARLRSSGTAAGGFRNPGADALHDYGLRRFLARERRLRGDFRPVHLSPQQARGAPATPADDVFALGVIWYQLLRDDLSIPPPAGGIDWIDDLAARGLDRGQIELVAAAFDPKPERRPPDARTLARAIRERFPQHLAKPRKPAAPRNDGDPRPGSGSTPDERPKGLKRFLFWR